MSALMSATAFSLLDHAGVLLPALAGFAALALGMDRHQSDLFGRELSGPATRRLRIGGWLLLLLSLWAAVARMGWSFGLVAYSGHTSAAAALVFVALLGWNRRQERAAAAARAK